VATGWAICPTGQRAVGGGITPVFTTLAGEVAVQISAPINTALSIDQFKDGDIARGWYGSESDLRGRQGNSYRVVAICSATSDAVVRTAPVTAPPSRPQHDDFADAYPVGPALPARTGGTNERAGREPGEAEAAEKSVWYAWTAPEDRAVVVSTCSSDFDTTLAVVTGETPGQLTEVAADDDGCGQQSRVTFQAHAGQTYRIAVNGKARATGRIVLRVHGAEPPQNDNLADATPVSGDLPLRATGVNLLATREAGEPDHAGDPGGASVWFAWTPSADGPVALDTCRSDFDTALAVYTGSAIAELSEVIGNDDNCGVRSRVSFVAHAGQTYKIAVDGQHGDSGAIVLRLTQAYPPANDDVEHAEPLTGTGAIAVESSNEDATRQPGEPDHGGRGGASVWYRWTAPASGPFAVETCGGTLDTLVGVYQGDSVATLTPVGADDDTCAPGSRVTFTATAGERYLIALDGRRAAAGAFQLRVEPLRAAPGVPALTAPAAANDNRPRITGTAPGASTVRLYADAACDGAPDWTGAAADLAGAGIEIAVGDDSRTEISARGVSAAGNLSECSAPVTVVEDSTAPAAPVIGSIGAERATGTAEPGATVELFAGTNCDGPVADRGSADAFASPGLEAGGAPAVTARATDGAGNASPCSAPASRAKPDAPRCAGLAVTIQGTAGRDVIRGTAGRDVIRAGGGADVVRALRGDDVICGGGGDDTIRGGNGDDDLRGGAGHDRLIGGPGHDTFHGGRAQDPDKRKKK
jgi:Ca2+-binding RTX toxin-like protein